MSRAKLFDLGLTAALLASLAACGSDDASTADASVDSTTADGASDATLPDSPFPSDDGDAGQGMSFDAWFDGYNLIDGGTLPDGAPCGPANWFGYNRIRTCCNGEVCEGFCEGLPDGSARCSCFGLVGGCGPQSSEAWCCYLSRGCQNGAFCEKP
ncbi:hypothetical protein BH09MYX1_BH09MYX1_57290 [soil metagenome]